LNTNSQRFTVLLLLLLLLELVAQELGISSFSPLSSKSAR
jgi:hypothetical protein